MQNTFDSSNAPKQFHKAHSPCNTRPKSPQGISRTDSFTPPITAWWSTEKVASTAIDAIVGKLSARDKGYFAYDYIELFLNDTLYPNLSRSREPLLNRGYFARVDTIRCVLLTFVQSIFEDSLSGSHSGVDFQIINIGAGLDPLYFWLKTEVEKHSEYHGTIKKFKYIELDLPDLVKEKNNSIRKSPELINRLMNRSNMNEECINCEDYVQIGCDLRNIEEMEAKCQGVINPSVPTLYLVECVLVYLEANEGDELLKWMTRAVPNAAIALCEYEPFNPKDRFGTMMSSNLALRGCPLLSLNAYSSLDAHMARYKKCGWGEISITDMYSIYNECLDPINRMRIEQLELFDEMEEWRLIQQHYFTSVAIRHAPNRTDYHPLTALISFWETCRLNSESENQCSGPRFSTEELRKTSSHLDVLEKVASKMLERRDSEDRPNRRYNQPGRASFDSEGIRDWLRQPFRSGNNSSKIFSAASAPNIKDFNRQSIKSGRSKHGFGSPRNLGRALDFVLEEQASPRGQNGADTSGDEGENNPDKNSEQIRPRLVADVLKSLTKKN